MDETKKGMTLQDRRKGLVEKLNEVGLDGEDILSMIDRETKFVVGVALETLKDRPRKERYSREEVAALLRAIETGLRAKRPTL